jgi:hypothetical protein
VVRQRRCRPGRWRRNRRPCWLIRPWWEWGDGWPSRWAGSAMEGGRLRRGPHRGRRWRCRPHPRAWHTSRWRRSDRWRWWRWWRCAELKYQPGAVLRVAEHDRPAVMDENRGHSHAVDVDAAFAAIDRYPLPAVVMQHHGGCAVDADVRPAVGADGHVPADGKGVSVGSEPDNQGGSERFRRHSPPFRAVV